MPHPEHAVDELTGGSTDGLRIFQSMRLAVEEGAVSDVRAAPIAGARRSRSPARTSDDGTLPTVEDALALGLTRAEYELVCEHQGGPPNQVELAMYSLLWSEHCAYKHSKKLLRTLPTEGEHVVMGPGENAGAVDVGGGLVCAFKVESHNHPTAVEPFQGAATGVGGILRDIFAIGARPIAVLDSLRFGELGGSGDRARATCSTGPSPGSATTATRSACPRSAARSTSRRPTSRTAWSTRWRSASPRASGSCAAPPPGPATCVILFGASTGRDGIGGASVLASAELGDGDDAGDKRPTVQVGDPFEEKKLLECSLELLERGLLVALQDLGAAGLTSSASEMASAGEVGIDIDVSLVPLRERDMEPFEIMVSESQERMLCVVEPAARAPTCSRCASAARYTARRSAPSPTRGACACSTVPSSSATCPSARSSTTARCMTSRRPAPPRRSTHRRRATLAPDASARECLLALLAPPNIASRRPAVRALRRDRPVAHRPPPRAGRRGRADDPPSGRGGARWRG